MHAKRSRPEPIKTVRACLTGFEGEEVKGPCPQFQRQAFDQQSLLFLSLFGFRKSNDLMYSCTERLESHVLF